MLEAAEEDLACVTLKRGCAFFVERGNNLIFSDSIETTTGPPPKIGDRVIVREFSRNIIGWGIYNPRSVYRVRIMQTMHDCRLDTDSVLDIVKLFRSNLEAAVKLRRNLCLPSDSTNAFRLVNSDGDHLSGVIIDQFADVVVVHSGVSWLELNRDKIVSVLKETLNVDTVVWRIRPAVLDKEAVVTAEENVYTSRSDLTMQSEISIVENYLHYWMAIGGQKTGFYTDQRENRLFLRSISKGKRVLDLCCYTGGFALNAALGGAAHVIGIDSSQPAIDCAQRNALLNSLQDRCRFECVDILRRLQESAKQNEAWDIVVLDPPKLAFSKSRMDPALNRYQKLNSAAMRVVVPGGILITCSCSGLVDVNRFMKTVSDAAYRIGKRLTIIRTSAAASDHVFDFNHPEGNYLKCIVARVW